MYFPHFASSSRLRARYLTHGRLGQYNAQISTNSKASLTSGTSLATTPTCTTTQRRRPFIHVDLRIFCAGKSPHSFYETQHPDQGSDISSDIDRQK